MNGLNQTIEKLLLFSAFLLLSPFLISSGPVEYKFGVQTGKMSSSQLWGTDREDVCLFPIVAVGLTFYKEGK